LPKLDAYVEATLRQMAKRRIPPNSPLLPPGQANPDLPGRHLAVFFLSVKINLSGANIRMSGKFANFVHGRAVTNGVVDGRLAERMDADAALAEPVGVDPGYGQ
jgi:hypothetical protein